MKDRVGQEVKVGDTVFYAAAHHRGNPYRDWDGPVGTKNVKCSLGTVREVLHGNYYRNMTDYELVAITPEHHFRGDVVRCEMEIIKIIKG